MAFFDNIGNAISQAGQNVVQKTKDTAEVVRLNGAIADEERRIQTLYTEIGKRYCELHTEDCDSALAESVLAVNEATAKIAQYRDQVMTLRGMIYCPACHGEMPAIAPTCPHCGAVNAAAPQPACRCKNCGQPLDADTAFCTNCGTKVEAPAPAPACANCGQPLAEGMLFCSQCGTKVEPPAPAPVCANCGQPLAEGMLFCTQCGTKV